MSKQHRPSKRTLPRRKFLKTSTAVAAGVIGAPLIVTRRAAAKRTAANDRITVGAIGVGGRASLLLDQLPEGAQIVALSDCNLPRAEAYKAKAN